jgi:hypothetical protein
MLPEDLAAVWNLAAVCFHYGLVQLNKIVVLGCYTTALSCKLIYPTDRRGLPHSHKYNYSRGRKATIISDTKT